MGALTDLEISKRIAAIEGVTLRRDSYLWTRCKHTAIEPRGEKYKPLKDDELCFRLMVKYKVSVDFIRPKEANIFGLEFHEFRGNPNKAICLAIIESNKES